MRMGAAIGAAGLALVLGAGPALAQSLVEVVSVDATDLPEVSLTISVAASSVEGSLGAEDFAVVVDGTRVLADVYAGVRDPMEVVVVIDTSGSMDGEPLTAAVAGAGSFIEALPASTRVALVTFGTEVTVHSEIADDRSASSDALLGLVAEGETALYDALATAATLFTSNDANRVVLVLSDGGDTVSATSPSNAREALRVAGAEVRILALDTAESDRAALADLASGGRVTTVAEAASLAAAYESVAIELSGRYRLEFKTPRTGVVEIGVFVNAPGGVLSTTIDVDLADASFSAPRPSQASPPGGFQVAATDAVPVIAAPGQFAQPWVLPAGVALVFVGVVGALWLSSRQKGVELVDEVVKKEAPPRSGLLAKLSARASSLGDSIANRRPAGSMDLALDRAGLALRPGEFVVVSATVVVVAVTGGLVLAGAAGAVVLGLAAALLPRTVLKMMAERRRSAFADQLEGTLQTIAGSIRSGYGLVQAMSTVAAEAPSPTSDEFNRVVVENRLGRSIEDSLKSMARRLENEDLEWVVEAIEIQHEVGGNLAEVLDTVAATIRERSQIRRQIKALSAEGRMSAIILIGLPFVLAGLISIMNPSYLAELTGTTIGKVMLGGATVMMGIGAAWIKRIVSVEF